MPLQALCRSVVRNMLRKNIELEHPLVKRAPKAKRRALRRLVVPLVESEDSSDEERSLKIGGVSIQTFQSDKSSAVKQFQGSTQGSLYLLFKIYRVIQDMHRGALPLNY